MKQPECELAREPAGRDEDWRRHAAACPDCSEILKVGEWMNRFAAGTNAPRGLPSAGLLLFKARLSQRLSSAERAIRPINAMAFLALFVAAASMGGVVFGTESRFGTILTEALGILATYAAAIALAAVAIAIMCVAIAYVFKRLEA